MTPEHKAILKDLYAREAAGTLAGKLYADIPNDVYHAGPGISSSNLKPYIARLFDKPFEVPDSKKAHFRFGNAYHAFILEPDLFKKEWKKSIAPIEGGFWITPEEYRLMEIMRGEFYNSLQAVDCMEDAKFELVAYSICPVTGVLQKARCDIFQNQKGLITINDLKSTLDPSIKEFAFTSRKYMYGVSAAYYLKVFGEVLKTILNNFKLIASGKQDPNPTRVYRVSQESIARGRSEVDAALDLIKNIREKGEDAAWAEVETTVREINI